MFSVVLPGRLPLTTPQQVDETHCVFPLQEADSISHVVVFMTGVQPFPPGFSATVHLLWPSPSASLPSSSSSSSAGGAGEWKLLGCLRNTKPSAIFKVNPPTTSSLPPQQGITATLGISIEPDHLVDSQIAALHSSSTTPLASGGETRFALTSAKPAASNAQATALEVAPKLAKNAFAYLSSFAPDSAPQTVPLLQKWLEQLERKLRTQGLAFLDKQD